jgi:hypothetical protein
MIARIKSAGTVATFGDDKTWTGTDATVVRYLNDTFIPDLYNPYAGSPVHAAVLNAAQFISGEVEWINEPVIPDFNEEEVN